MPTGPGKYDGLCTLVRERSNAQAAIVIVINGRHGSGFSVQAHDEPLTLTALADMLDNVSAEIRRSMREG